MQYTQKAKEFMKAQRASCFNPLFNDTLYRECFIAAMDSPCAKMKFGCIITMPEQNDPIGTVIHTDCNRFIEPLRSLCEPDCIRNSIASRTESMIGACGHAEEWSLWETIKKGIPLSKCELYIAGFKADNLMWVHPEPEHTCLRCSVQMYQSGIAKIHIPVIDHWVGISPAKALETARDYALRVKSVS